MFWKSPARFLESTRPTLSSSAARFNETREDLSRPCFLRNLSPFCQQYCTCEAPQLQNEHYCCYELGRETSGCEFCDGHSWPTYPCPPSPPPHNGILRPCEESLTSALLTGSEQLEFQLRPAGFPDLCSRVDHPISSNDDADIWIRQQDTVSTEPSLDSSKSSRIN